MKRRTLLKSSAVVVTSQLFFEGLVSAVPGYAPVNPSSCHSSSLCEIKDFPKGTSTSVRCGNPEKNYKYCKTIENKSQAVCRYTLTDIEAHRHAADGAWGGVSNEIAIDAGKVATICGDVVVP